MLIVHRVDKTINQYISTINTRCGPYRKENHVNDLLFKMLTIWLRLRSNSENKYIRSIMIIDPLCKLASPDDTIITTVT